MSSSSRYTSVDSDGSSIHSQPTAIAQSGCRSVLFTVVAATEKLHQPTFHLKMGTQRVSTSAVSSPGKSRVFGSVVLPYDGERSVKLDAVSRSGKILGNHFFDLSKIPNLYSYYDGTVELTKKGRVLGTLDIRIDFSNKKVKKIVDRKGIFAACTGRQTATFEGDIKKKGNLCNAVVSDGSSIDNGRRRIFLNKSESSQSSAMRKRKLAAMAAVPMAAAGASRSSSTRSHSAALAAPVAYGAALAKSMSMERRLSSSDSLSRLPRISSSSSASIGVQKTISPEPISPMAVASPVVAVAALNAAGSSSSPGSPKSPKRRDSSSSVDVDAHIVKPKRSSSLGSKRRRKVGKTSNSPRKAQSSVTPKSKFSCGKICGGKKETNTVTPSPVDVPSSPKKEGKSLRKKRTGKKIPKKANSTTNSPMRRTSSCSSIRSKQSIASSCIGKKAATPVAVAVTRKSSSSSVNPSPVNPVPPPDRSHSSSSSSSTEVAVNHYPSSVASFNKKRRRKASHKNTDVSTVGSRKSVLSCASSKQSKFSCGSRRRKNRGSQSMVSDLSSIADVEKH